MRPANGVFDPMPPLINRPATLADRIGADVEYRGQNVRHQHMFANGSVLVTDIFDTLEQAVARFGPRVKIKDKVLKHSTVYQQGYKDAETGKFFIREQADQQERHEYGSGYIKRLLEMLEAPKAMTAPTPKAADPIAPKVPTPEPKPVAPPPEPPTPTIEPTPKKHRGRKPGSKNRKSRVTVAVKTIDIDE